ncbi:MAG: acyl-CoA thioesterase [Bacteroidales bacterium]|nr:acyl-CoA thioesterase [Bacteroidales bacterium]
MVSSEIRIRVRYGEVDRMGYLHHGNYALYFEEGRTELLRGFGFSYRKMEDDGILLPVREMHIQYLKPVLYDEEVVVETTLTKKPGVKLEFEYSMHTISGDILSKASTTLVFTDAKTRKVIRAPEYFLKLVSPYFE